MYYVGAKLLDQLPLSCINMDTLLHSKAALKHMNNVYVEL